MMLSSSVLIIPQLKYPLMGNWIRIEDDRGELQFRRSIHIGLNNYIPVFLYFIVKHMDERCQTRRFQPLTDGSQNGIVHGVVEDDQHTSVAIDRDVV